MVNLNFTSIIFKSVNDLHLAKSSCGCDDDLENFLFGAENLGSVAANLYKCLNFFLKNLIK